MKQFESTTLVARPINEVYDFLADMNNHKRLMPDNVQDWASTSDEASFSIQNMGKLSVAVESRVQNREIKIIPTSRPPFNLDFTWSLSQNENGTLVLFTIAADLNMMMKMIAAGPLQKLAGHETQSLTSILSPG